MKDLRDLKDFLQSVQQLQDVILDYLPKWPIRGTNNRPTLLRQRHARLRDGFRMRTGLPELQERPPPLGPYRRPMPRVLGGS